MKRLALLLALVALLCMPANAPAASPAQGNFGIFGYDIAFGDKDGAAVTQAGSHPFALTSSLGFNVDSEELPEGRPRHVFLEQIPGLVADTTAYPTCTTLEFLQIVGGEPLCQLESAIGISATSASIPGKWLTTPLYNVSPPPGVLLRLGFYVESTPLLVDVALDPEYPNSGIAITRNIPQALDVFANKTQLWGDPSDDAHDELRGPCGSDLNAAELPPGDLGFQFEGNGKSCGVEPRSKPLLTLPTYCGEPLRSSYEAFSWEGVTALDDGFDAGSSPGLQLTGCSGLPAFSAAIGAVPTSRAAGSPTGLDLSIEVEDEGLTSVGGLSQSRIRKAVFTLPEGMTGNPSVADGLEVCTEADLEEETLDAPPGEGCPQASKLGTIEVESPLVSQPLPGSLYIAEPYENRFGTLLAFFIVVKSPELGILVKQATRVEPDPRTGRLVGIAEDIPPTAAFSSFKLHFREGGRSPLITPPGCGSHTVSAELTPWSGTAPITEAASFQIVSGPNEGPCPKGGTPPFDPGFDAGAAGNAAGAFSPFSMRLTRRDGDQDLTRFDIDLPPGVLAKLAGVSRCADSRIVQAKARTGIAERQSPSCPANSKIGTVWGGAGVGSQLTYVPGSLYMAGPFGGEPLSVVGIVPAVAGPFDVGTVVVRQALHIDPRTGEVSVDGAHSDPIPHILAGIPLSVRDVQVHVDRPEFTLNPTDCDPFATRAAIWGGGSNLLSALDDSPVSREARFQAADCARLGFKPRLSLQLRGGTGRGAHPALRAVLRPRRGDANLEDTVVRLPRSAFLEQAHIRTVCTRVQYAADACPQGAIYGRVRAFTPLLDEPLEGSAYLRSSDNKLPDLVFSLHGLVDFEAVARIDSKRGGIRATFTGVPDAPLSKVVVNMQGARKGLIVNSTDLCTGKRRANVRLGAHNNRQRTLRPVMKARCGKQRGRRSRGR